MISKPKIVIIVGPTGVGKSAMAVALALRCRGEIINADAMQVYRHMDIGTAKPSQEERQGIEHHLIDVVDPDEEFSAARFAELATAKIQEINSREHRAIVAGGTGLYIKALTRGLFKGPGADPALREKYRDRISRFGLDSLYRELRDRDAESAARIHPNDSVRIIRALEILEITGEPIAVKQNAHAFGDEPYAALKIGLKMDRTPLYDRINSRCRGMVSRGLIEEVKELLQRGYHENLKPMQALGYKQIVRYLKGECELDAALEDMSMQTRRYAKRQSTWFRADQEIEWHRPDEIGVIEERVKEFYSEKGCAEKS
jgi:tRNA dimethylallyltransferase